MIINTFIGSNSNVQNIDLTTPEIFLEKVDGDTIELSFSYTNSKSLKGYSLVYLDGDVIDNRSVNSGSTVSIDVTSYLTSTGFYTFKLIVIDEEKSIDSLDFKVLYNYQNTDNFSFIYQPSNSTYTLSVYSGSASDVNIPPLFNGDQGVLPVSKIGNGVFYDNDNILSVVIPDGIASIGVTAFFSCSNLRSVTVNSETPPVLEGDNVFDPYDELSLLKIYVPASAVNAYRAAQYWSEYANDILPIS